MGLFYIPGPSGGQRLTTEMKLKQEDALFVIPHNSQCQTLTIFRVQKQLASVIMQINLDPKDYGFHMFPRSGVSLAHNLKIPLANIKQHGQWKTEAIYTYLRSSPAVDAVIPLAFQQHVLT